MKTLQFKIQLKDYKPSVYKTILVPQSATFYDLHSYIQDAFWFIDYHLWNFTKWNLEITNPFDLDHEPFCQRELKAEKTKLIDIFWDWEGDFKEMIYTYDFGDNWEFSVKFEKEVELKEKEDLPKILRWKGGLLIEDCWGAWRLQELVKDYKNKKFDKDIFENFKDFEIYLDEFLDFDIKDIEFEDSKNRYKTMKKESEKYL